MMDEIASPHWLEEFLLLGLACLLIRSWYRTRPHRAWFAAAIALVSFAAGLSIWQVIWPATERDVTVTILLCVAAVLTPALAMMRPLFVRLVKSVFPRARLVRTRRSRA